jgi:hypothetical protein
MMIMTIAICLMGGLILPTSHPDAAEGDRGSRPKGDADACRFSAETGGTATTGPRAARSKNAGNSWYDVNFLVESVRSGQLGIRQRNERWSY